MKKKGGWIQAFIYDTMCILPLSPCFVWSLDTRCISDEIPVWL